MDTGVPKALLPTFKREFQAWTQVSLVNGNLHVFPEHNLRRELERIGFYVPFKYDMCKVYIHKGTANHLKIESIRCQTVKDWGY